MTISCVLLLSLFLSLFLGFFVVSHLHITAVGGEEQLIKLDSDLKPENSKSYSLSAVFYKQFGKVQTNLLVEDFYTDIL